MLRVLLIVATATGCSSSAPTPSSGDVESRFDMNDMSDGPGSCEGVVRPFSLTDERGEASAVVRVVDCRRRYELSSTAARRNDRPASPRIVDEVPGWSQLRTTNALVDGLYAMTLEEARQNSVDAISDAAFAGGEPVACPAGGCFETGAEWHYVWTRDIAYATHLGLAELDPVRALNSLMFKVSERRGGGDAQVVQDTGTGGSYPVSTDRVVWALGVVAVLAQLDDEQARAVAETALDVLQNTARHDRAVAFDPARGLYRGEQSFLDWREQSYPSWVEGEPAHIAASYAFGTNLLHLQALVTLTELGAYTGRQGEVADIAAWIAALRTSLSSAFSLGSFGLRAAYVLDRAPPARQVDLLATALSIHLGFDDGDAALEALGAYPHFGVGAPVFFPQQQFTPIYHNRAEWPFVSAYWLRAAAQVRHDTVAVRMFETLLRGAALNLSNMENWEIATGAAWVEDGAYSGPVVNSQRQLWSVAAFVSMIHHTMFGLQPAFDARGPTLRIRPSLPRAIRAAYFADADRLELFGYPYRGRRLDVRLNLPADAGTGGFYEVDAVRIDGVDAGEDLDPPDGAQIEVDLVVPDDTSSKRITVRDPTDWREVFAPRPPVINGIDNSTSTLTFRSDDDAVDIEWNVYRDGVRIAAGLRTATFDDDGAPTSCYTVEACFRGSRNCSLPSETLCVADSQQWDAPALVAQGGELVEQYGALHWASWGDPGHRLTVGGVTVASDGPHRLQVMYGNGAGPIATGVSCGVKRVLVTDESDGAVVADQTLAMPQLGTWDDWSWSTPIEVELRADRTYTVELVSDDERAVNMSSFAHFASYTAHDAIVPFNRVNVAALRMVPALTDRR